MDENSISYEKKFIRKIVDIAKKKKKKKIKDAFSPNKPESFCVIFYSLCVYMHNEYVLNIVAFATIYHRLEHFISVWMAHRAAKAETFEMCKCSMSCYVKIWKSSELSV